MLLSILNNAGKENTYQAKRFDFLGQNVDNKGTCIAMLASCPVMIWNHIYEDIVGIRISCPPPPPPKKKKKKITFSSYFIMLRIGLRIGSLKIFLCDNDLILYYEFIAWDLDVGVQRLVSSPNYHYNDVIMSAMASQITGVSIAHSTVCSGTDQRKHQRSVLLAFVRGIHRWPVDSPHKRPVTRKMLPFDGVIITSRSLLHFLWMTTRTSLAICISHLLSNTFYTDDRQQKNYNLRQNNLRAWNLVHNVFSFHGFHCTFILNVIPPATVLHYLYTFKLMRPVSTIKCKQYDLDIKKFIVVLCELSTDLLVF